MIPSFEFYTGTRIIFGKGKRSEVPARAVQMGKTALVVSGNNPERASTLIEQLTQAGVQAHHFTVSGEPSIRMIQDGLQQAREHGCDLIIGIGGGSVLDAGKAISALLTNPGDPLDYLEGIGHGQLLTNLAAPYIAIPTTSGTGSEVTSNAVLSSPEHQAKVSLRSPLMQPRLAVVDPELTVSLPREVTASAGMDALTQLIEPFTTHQANPMTDALCREGLQRAARSLHRVYADGSNVAAREDMALAALFSGIALANAKLGAVHGLAGPIGGLFSAPHGAVCACLLPPVTAMNIKALRERTPENPALERYAECARTLTGSPNATPDDLVAWLLDLRSALDIPPLSAYGITEANIPAIIPKAFAASSMKGNPIALTEDELAEILIPAL